MLARSIGTGLLIPNTLSADYNEAFNLAGKDFDTEIAVYEGTEGGKRLTGIQVAGGDTVTFEAHGSIWCGVFGAGRNGPDGWTGWVARGNDWPLPGSKVHMLIGSWDGVHWWEIGSGGSVTREPADPASFLWLHINDNDPYNGNGQFDVQIHVRRAARTAPGIGFAP